MSRATRLNEDVDISLPPPKNTDTPISGFVGTRSVADGIQPLGWPAAFAPDGADVRTRKPRQRLGDRKSGSSLIVSEADSPLFLNHHPCPFLQGLDHRTEIVVAPAFGNRCSKHLLGDSGYGKRNIQEFALLKRHADVLRHPFRREVCVEVSSE